MHGPGKGSLFGTKSRTQKCVHFPGPEMADKSVRANCWPSLFCPPFSGPENGPILAASSRAKPESVRQRGDRVRPSPSPAAPRRPAPRRAPRRRPRPEPSFARRPRQLCMPRRRGRAGTQQGETGACRGRERTQLPALGSRRRCGSRAQRALGERTSSAARRNTLRRHARKPRCRPHSPCAPCPPARSSPSPAMSLTTSVPRTYMSSSHVCDGFLAAYGVPSWPAEPLAGGRSPNTSWGSSVHTPCVLSVCRCRCSLP